MQIKIELKGDPLSEAGVDKQALIENIDAEVRKLGDESGAKPRRKDKPAPAGAQGDFDAVQWLIDLAQDPKMAATYARMLLFAVDQIIRAANASKARKKGAKDGEKKSADDDSSEKKVGTFAAMGKMLALPATTAAIEAFLKSLGDDQ